MKAKPPPRAEAAKDERAAAIADAALKASRAISNAKPEERGPLVRDMIETAAKRLTGIVEEETEALRNGLNPDLKKYNARKSLGLVELNRALQFLDGGKPETSTVRILRDLNARLEGNRQLLRLHMEALGEITAIISQSIREAESDGTYTLAFRSKEQKP